MNHLTLNNLLRIFYNILIKFFSRWIYAIPS